MNPQEGTQMNADKLRLYHKVLANFAKHRAGEGSTARINEVRLFAPAVMGVHDTDDRWAVIFSTKTRRLNEAEATKWKFVAVTPEAWKPFGQAYIPVKSATGQADFTRLLNQVAKTLLQPVDGGSPIEWLAEPEVIDCRFLYAQKAPAQADPAAPTLAVQVGAPSAGGMFDALQRMAETTLPPLEINPDQPAPKPQQQ